MGALYLDGGLDVVWSRLESWFAREAEAILAEASYVDAKSQFQEWAQAEHSITPTYCIIAEEGPDHAKTFTAQVLLGNKRVGQGQGSSKRTAEQAAALQALKSFVHLDPTVDS